MSIGCSTPSARWGRPTSGDNGERRVRSEAPDDRPRGRLRALRGAPAASRAAPAPSRGGCPAPLRTSCGGARCEAAGVRPAVRAPRPGAPPAPAPASRPPGTTESRASCPLRRASPAQGWDPGSDPGVRPLSAAGTAGPFRCPSRRACAVLTVERLTKRYGGLTAIRDLSFTLHPGEVLGLLGPNGSGKSTTVKIITGLLQPTSGHVYLDGKEALTDLPRYKAIIGYVPEEPHLYTYLTGPEYLRLIGRLRLLPESVLDEKIDRFLQLLGIFDDRYQTLS